MDIHPTLQFFIQYGYWFAVPLMIIEGPIVTMTMGFLASLGFFNIFIVIALGCFSDLISDSIYYFTGYHGGARVMKKLKLDASPENRAFQDIKARFEDHPGKIFFGTKVLPGVAYATFVLAGVIRFKYLKMMRHAILGGIVWSAGLGTLGYYFGNYVTDISNFLTRTGIILFSIVILLLLYKFWFGKYLSQKFAVWRPSSSPSPLARLVPRSERAGEGGPTRIGPDEGA